MLGGPTTVVVATAGVSDPALAVSVNEVPLVEYEQLEKVTVPLERRAGERVVQLKPPLVEVSVTLVEESVVSTLPYWSCSATTTENLVLVLVAAGGGVVYTSVVAAPGVVVTVVVASIRVGFEAVSVGVPAWVSE